ncbi:DUF4817 domain-containing protein [Trichonephila clavipes]|nr:DUF4817 domain-containing protein [Trichonephila clavipes]
MHARAPQNDVKPPLVFKRLHPAATGSLRMVAMYSVRDYCDMYLMYGRCNGNTLRTAREYARRYPPKVNIHDGAPAHFYAPVRDWLDIAFPGRWIRRQGSVLWLSCSPDFTPLDFFQWGHLQELVYRDVVTTQMDLVAGLNPACTSVDPVVMRRVKIAIPQHAQVCLDMHGGHFENLP